MNRKMTNRSTFRAKMMYEMYCSQVPLYGKLWSRMDVIPVPMLTLNHDGVKLRTIFRHPRWFLHGFVSPPLGEDDGHELSHPLLLSCGWSWQLVPLPAGSDMLGGNVVQRGMEGDGVEEVRRAACFCCFLLNPSSVARATRVGSTAKLASLCSNLQERS